MIGFNIISALFTEHTEYWKKNKYDIQNLCDNY